MTETGRIFGIGMSKTGTSSLNEALIQLGFPSVHYPYDEETIAQLREGRYRLSVLETHRAITDLPAVPFYAQFDALYPGSRFVLTVRDLDDWLESCETHWRLLTQWWDNVPRFRAVQEFLGACVYGTIGFDRDRFAWAYETHERNVRHHFRDRPDDLLVLNVCAGEGWERLCPFLGVAAPDGPFPRANDWMHRLLDAARDVCEAIPEGATFLLADQQGFGADFAVGRVQMPFPQRDGVWWGNPADDADAGAELERMREAGARYLVIGWPSFWWRDVYPEFDRRLRATYPCVLESARVWIFDLRP